MPDIWCAYFVLDCAHALPDPKDKLVVIVCIDRLPMGFLVNSSIRPYVQKRPELMVGQVSIAATDYSFLEHDSYVDCTTLYAFGNSELRNSRGAITEQTKEAILEAVENTTTVERRYKDLILPG